MSLAIRSLDRTETFAPGTLRYFLPTAVLDRDDSGWAVLLTPVSPDNALAQGTDGYGRLWVLTPYGAREVTSVDVGVWIEQTD